MFCVLVLMIAHQVGSSGSRRDGVPLARDSVARVQIGAVVRLSFPFVEARVRPVVGRCAPGRIRLPWGVV